MRIFMLIYLGVAIWSYFMGFLALLLFGTVFVIGYIGLLLLCEHIAAWGKRKPDPEEFVAGYMVGRMDQPQHHEDHFF